VNLINKIVAEAEVDKVASQRCLQAVGFFQEGNEPDEEGFLSFIYATAKTVGHNIV